MAIIIGMVLALLSVGVVVYPFWKRRLGAPPDDSANPYPPDADLEPDLQADLQSAYESIRTLQLEHGLGSIPLGLYREQLQDYRVQAALILRRQAEAAAQDVDWLLQQEVGLARAALARANGSANVCPNCGAVFELVWSQCPECTAELTGRPSPGRADSPVGDSTE